MASHLQVVIVLICSGFVLFLFGLIVLNINALRVYCQVGVKNDVVLFLLNF